MTEPYITSLRKEVLSNPFYRRVLFTTDQMQLVVMRIPPFDYIPPEVHPSTTQWISIVEGKAVLTVEETIYLLQRNEVILIPAGARHSVVNVGENDLCLYTLYAPPEHPEGYILEERES